MVPAYYRSRQGRVFRVHRVSQSIDADHARYVLRAVPLRAGGVPPVTAEAAREVDTASLRDRIRLRQIVPTPEETFEQLWQQLRVDLETLAERL
jgi:hypothetical protein